MVQIIRDNSIGQALAAFGSALSPDPSQAWQAAAFKAKVAGIQTDNAKAAFDLKQAQDQRAAQDAVTNSLNGLFQPGNFNVPQQVEGPRPMAATMGPMPAVHNPEYDTLEAKLNFARNAGRNAMMRGGSPEQALQAAYGSLGMGQVLVGGVPQNEGDARQMQTMLTGQLPAANTPLSEEQRRVMAVEAQNAKLKDAVSVPQNGTVIMSPEQGQSLGVKPNPDGQYIATGSGQPDAGGVPGQFAGDSISAQQYNTLIRYQMAKNSGQPISPELEMAAQIAWNALYGTKTTYKTDEAGNQIPVPIQDSVPQAFPQPGGPAGPAAPAPMPVTPSVSGVVQPAAPSVSAAAPPVSGAPAMPATPGGVNPVIQGPEQFRPESVMRKNQFVSTMETSLGGMNAMFQQGYVPRATGQILNKVASRADGTLTTDIIAVAANSMMDGADQQYWTNAGNFLNAVLRDESGAAVPEQEYPRYLSALIPQAGDKPERIAQKRALMQAAIDARKQGFAAKQVAGMIASSPTFQPDAAAAAPAPGGAPAGQIDPAQARADAVKAHAAIDAQPISDAEKARKHQAVDARMNQIMRGGQP